MVGSRTIERHDTTELLSSYFKGEAQHILHPNSFDYCNHIIGKVLSRYRQTETRETAAKVGKSKHGSDGEVNDKRFKKDDKIDQFQLLRHFISAVVILNPVWDIGLQNIMTQQNYYTGDEVPIASTFALHCPCSRRFRKWRSYYPKQKKYCYCIDYPIDDDKKGFHECQSGEFSDVLEFYKHLVQFEEVCFYHEAMIDIFSILYPVIYQSAANKKKHKHLLSLQKHTESNHLVRTNLQIYSSLHFFTVYR